MSEEESLVARESVQKQIAKIKTSFTESLGLSKRIPDIDEKSQEELVDVMAKTAVEVAGILGVDIPPLVVNRKLVGTKTLFQHVPADQEQPARIEANPAFLDSKGVVLERESTSCFLRAIAGNSIRYHLAHEFWHLKTAQSDTSEERVEERARTGRALRDLPRAEALIIWNADMEEQAADWFALGYIQGREAPDFQSRLGKLVVEIDGLKDQLFHRMAARIKPAVVRRHEFLRGDPFAKKMVGETS